MGGGSGRRTPEGRLDHGGRWRRATDWPPPEMQPTAFYLHGSGLLSRRMPAAAAPLAYDFDPDNPVPTIGGAIASGAPIMHAGAFDQRETSSIFGARHPGRALAERPDVLVFETQPLAQDIELTGPVLARLWVSSSAPDTDFTIKLVDVHPPSADYPSGYAMNLTHGIIRMRFRNGFERAELMEPGRIYEVEIEAFPTANLFKAGHRIRVDIASSNFPHFDINPNTGMPAGADSPPLVARNRIHVGDAHPSHILLPYIPGA
jgi:putative CocE/NonD family hydrolase